MSFNPETNQTPYLDSICNQSSGGNQLAICQSLINISRNFAARGKLDSCQVYFEKSNELAKEIGNEKAKQQGLKVIGYSHYFIGNFKQALIYFNESLVICERNGYNAEAGEITHQIAVTYANIEEYDVSISNVLKVLNVAKKLNDELLMIKANNMLANLYCVTNEYDKAEAKYMETIDWVNAHLTDYMKTYFLGGIYAQLGEIERSRNEFEKSRAFFQRAIENFEGRNSRTTLIYHCSILNSFLEQGNLEKANNEYLKILDQYDKETFELAPVFFFI